MNPLSWRLRGLCEQEVVGVALPLSAMGWCRAVWVKGDCLGYTNPPALLPRRPAVLGLRCTGLRHQRPPAPLRAGGFGTRLWVSRLGWAKGFLPEPCWGADGARPLQRERLWEGNAWLCLARAQCLCKGRMAGRFVTLAGEQGARVPPRGHCH